MALSLHYAARSDVGLVRGNNQDSAYASPRLLVVADGMGGHAGGDVASSVAVGVLAGLDGEAHGADALQRLQQAIATAQDDLLARAGSTPELAGMGTTVTALLRSGDRLVLAHIGDSRAYLLRGGDLAQVTTDHTFVQLLIDEGRITPEEAEHHPQRSVIMRVLGDVDSTVELDTSVLQALPGDRWMLCSDGLSGIVSHDTIAETLREVEDVGACADRLVQLALRGGGPDNVTCVVADVVDDRGGGDARRASLDTTPQVVGSAALDRARASAAARSPASRAAELGRAAPTQEIPTSGSTAERGADGAARARTFRRRRLVVGAVLLVAVLGAGALAASAWLGRQYFVGASGGRVAIFSGLPQDVGPVGLSTVVSLEDLRVADLPAVYRQRVASTIAASGLDDARRIVDDLGEQATGSTAGAGGGSTLPGTETPRTPGTSAFPDPAAAPPSPSTAPVGGAAGGAG